jgi:glycerol-3-phosphate O-acyltransferase / dihydroxyacetone phosphate acyltransferase
MGLRAPSEVGWLARTIARATGWAAGAFYELDHVGPEVPSGPVLLVANHPNALIDPVIVFRVAGRPARPLAKAPLFEHPLIGPPLKGLGGLPVYRKKDDPALMHRNDTTFDAAIQALKGGDAVQIFPEGTSHSEPSLAPLRTGAARIALQAEERAGWTLGLQIVPIGLTYARKKMFRSRALAVVGEAFGVADLREVYERDEVDAARLLTERITDALEAVTLNLSTLEDHRLIDVAERLYARSKRTPFEERERLAARFPRLQQFAEGLAWLRAHDPERHAKLAAAVDDYDRRARRLGSEGDDVPSRYRARSVASYVLVQGLALAVGLPLAALGALFWGIPYLLPRLVLSVVPVTEDAIATYKLLTSLIFFPLVYAAWITLAAVYLGTPGAVTTALLLPVLGAFALRWGLRWERVKADARVFARVIRHPRYHDRLVEERKRIAAEIDAVRALLDSRGVPEPPA